MKAVLGLGSSVPEARRVVDACVAALSESEAVALRGRSQAHVTAPLGGVAHSRFINAAVAIETRASPRGLLALCQALEQRAGRVRTIKNAPRTLDVDVLYIEGVRTAAPWLTVPHPGLFVRDFAWLPLVEAVQAAGWSVPARPWAAT